MTTHLLKKVKRRYQIHTPSLLWKEPSENPALSYRVTSSVASSRQFASSPEQFEQGWAERKNRKTRQILKRRRKCNKKRNQAHPINGRTELTTRPLGRKNPKPDPVYYQCFELDDQKKHSPPYHFHINNPRNIHRRSLPQKNLQFCTAFSTNTRTGGRIHLRDIFEQNTHKKWRSRILLCWDADRRWRTQTSRPVIPDYRGFPATPGVNFGL